MNIMSTSKGKKEMNAKVESTVKFAAVLLSQILVDPDFNARHKNHMKETSGVSLTNDSGTAHGIPSLADSIEESGQDTPVVLIPNTDKKTNASKPYFLVAGFRRYAALELIANRATNNNVEHPIKNPDGSANTDWSAKAPTITAQVKNLTKAQAYLENLRENTARDNLSGPDLAFGVYRQYRALVNDDNGKERGKPTELARSLGKDPSYIMQLLRIMSLPEDITNHWRVASKPLPINTMDDLADPKKVPEAERLERYKQWNEGQAAKDDKKGEKTEDSEIAAAHKSVATTAQFLGRLHELGHIDCNDTAWMSRELLRELGTVKKTVMGDDDKKWLGLAKAAKEAFEAGREEVKTDKAKAAEKAEKKAEAAEKRKTEKVNSQPTN
jgi:ParB-like chromosome segregation protein Spo0J